MTGTFTKRAGKNLPSREYIAGACVFRHRGKRTWAKRLAVNAVRYSNCRLSPREIYGEREYTAETEPRWATRGAEHGRRGSRRRDRAQRIAVCGGSPG